MKVSIYGVGYVGLVTAACLAEVGNTVVCYDIDSQKIDKLNQGIVPIFEPGLAELVQRNREQHRLFFEHEIDRTVQHGFIHFIAVGTPTGKNKAADLTHVMDAARAIGERLQQESIIVTKSTVPVGTTERVAEVIADAQLSQPISAKFHVLSNPEFLKEGNAVNDFMKPDRIIIGANNMRAAEHLKQLYAPFNRNRDRVMILDIRSAELTKYAANAMLAMKISFMNEFSQLAEAFGADIEQIRRGIAEDPRIGPHFIYPGCGYGGSCFPKDVRAIIHMAEQFGVQAKLVEAVDERNEAQKQVLFDKVKYYFHHDLAGKNIAVWGLAFKPNTDDIREAPSQVLLECLWQAGANIHAFDPAANEKARSHYGDIQQLTLFDDPYAAVKDADALMVLTEWNLFRSPDFQRIKQLLKHAVIFDGRNLYDPAYLDSLGIQYYAIGRGLKL